MAITPASLAAGRRVRTGRYRDAGPHVPRSATVQQPQSPAFDVHTPRQACIMGTVRFGQPPTPTWPGVLKTPGYIALCPPVRGKGIMSTLLIALASFLGFFVAYHTYGRYLARKIFRLNPSAAVPSRQLRDDVDYVPTRKAVIFGHHFTSIAGTGPIVGPAIAVLWGWLPALLWVMFGCIFIGAVHDFGALVVSLRNRGQTVGEIAGRMIHPRARSPVPADLVLLAHHCAGHFRARDCHHLPALPGECAVGVGRHAAGCVDRLLGLSLGWFAVAPVASGRCRALPGRGRGRLLPADRLARDNAIVTWTVLLMIYCFLASVLPVWMLLQPRDFINSHQLVVALLLAGAGHLGGRPDWPAEHDRQCPGRSRPQHSLPRGDTANLPVSVHYHRLWRGERVPLPGQQWYEQQAGGMRN